MFNKLYAFELSGRTRKMILPTLIAAIPIIPGGMVMIPKFIRMLVGDIKSQWTGIRLYSRAKETQRIQQMYNIRRVD